MGTPTERRDYEAFLRGPGFAFGTVTEYRAGVLHAGLMTVAPEPSDTADDEDFGIIQASGFTVEIADEADDSDWYLLWEDGSRIVLEDGSGSLILEY